MGRPRQPPRRLTPKQQELVLSCLDHAKKIARRWEGRSGPHGRLADIEGAALEGLCVAAARFDPDMGVKFESYAAWVINGHVIDSLRSASATSTRHKPFREIQVFRLQDRDLESKTRETYESRVAEPNDPFFAVHAADGVEDLIQSLPMVHKRIMRKLYLDARSGGRLKGAGLLVGLGEARISQIHSESIRLIRERLAREA